MPDTNGQYVTRNELGAHMRRVDDNLDSIRADVSEIRSHMGAGPRWLGQRATAVVDKFLPAAITVAALLLLGDKL